MKQGKSIKHVIEETIVKVLLARNLILIVRYTFRSAVSHVQLYLHAYISVHCKVIKIDGSGTGAKCTLLGTTNILLSIRNPGHLGRSENETKKSLQSKKAHTQKKKIQRRG